LLQALRNQGQENSAAWAKLAVPESVTVTTGQQIGLGLGPLYTVLKIADTIALARVLEKHLKVPVVPVFWMATEDHDAQEINHVWCGNQKISHRVVPAQHSVGPLPASLALPALHDLQEAVHGTNAERIAEVWSQIYRHAATLAEAVRTLVFRYFDSNELLVLDPMDLDLKRSFAPVLVQEARESVLLTAWQQTQKNQPDFPGTPIEPQRFNALVWNEKGERRYPTAEVDSLALAQNHPEVCSPNALLRPVYQEYILPNVAYVGGPGEAVYWSQLPLAFAAFGIPFPVFKRRSGATWLSPQGRRAWQKAGLLWSEVPVSPVSAREELQKAAEESMQMAWSEWQIPMEQGFRHLAAVSERMDTSLQSMAAAWKAKMDRERRRWEEHARRWSAKTLSAADLRLEVLQREAYPQGIPQERVWSAMWAESHAGVHFATDLTNNLDAWKSEHLIWVDAWT
jgi:uncharacterized protein YllA (UPF0747 family)